MKNKEDQQFYEELKKKHESDLTKKERRILEKEKLSTMSFGKKIGYLWIYYKIWLVVLLIVAAVGNVLWNMYDESKNNRILGVIAANVRLREEEGLLETAFKDYIKNENKRDLVTIYTNLNFSDTIEENEDGSLGLAASSQVDYATLSAFIAHISSGDVDVMLCPEAVYKVYDSQGFFTDLTEILPDDMLKKTELTQEGTALLLPSESPILQYAEFDYAPVYVTIIKENKNPEMAVQYLHYLIEN